MSKNNKKENIIVGPCMAVILLFALIYCGCVDTKMGFGIVLLLGLMSFLYLDNKTKTQK